MQSYKPMLAKNFPKPFSHNDWLFEVKWDGFRALAYVKDGFSLRSRNDNELKRNFPKIEELRVLAKDVVLDGEPVVMMDGTPDFQAMQEGKYVCIVDSIDKLGEEYYKVIAANGLEGVVAKKKDSTYEQGKRSDSWLKIKQLQSCFIFACFHFSFCPKAEPTP
jgi:bifunctional non-homologous end joining protein LigD